MYVVTVFLTPFKSVTVVITLVKQYNVWGPRSMEMRLGARLGEGRGGSTSMVGYELELNFDSRNKYFYNPYSPRTPTIQ